MVNTGKPLGSRSPLDDENTRQQLTRLFGESLVGGWPELNPIAGQKARIRRPRFWTKLGLFAAVTVGVVVLLGRASGPGLVRRDTDDRAHYASELSNFLTDGDLEQSSSFVRLVQGKPLPTGIEDPHRFLIERSQAALYRYYDADPQRVQGILSALSKQASEPQLRVVALTIASRAERAQATAELSELTRRWPRDGQLQFLLATALESSGEVAAAREAYGRSEDLGPAWLPHRFDQVEFERRQGRTDEVNRLVDGMTRANPESAWSVLAQSVFRGHQLAQPQGSAVQRAKQALFAAIAARQKADPSDAQRNLSEAISLVKSQAPFLIDFAEALLRDGTPQLARWLVDTPDWARTNSPVKAEMEQRVRAAETQARPTR